MAKVKVGNTFYNQISTNQPEELKKSFPYEINDFTFLFSATSYIANNPSQFSCILEGEDEKWSNGVDDWFITERKNIVKGF